MLNNKINAFTLAEVLITLGIIGVVAAMTIPTLMNKTQDQEFKVAYKKAYSEINQAAMLLKNDNGGTLAGLFTDAGTTESLFAGKLKVLSSCVSPTSAWACPNPAGDNVAATISLSDGAFLAIGMTYPNCNQADWDIANFGQSLCTEIYIDVNGLKKPNKAGKDEFWVGIGPEKVIPAGMDGMVNANYKCPDGVFCNSFKYLYE